MTLDQFAIKRNAAVLAGRRTGGISRPASLRPVRMLAVPLGWGQGEPSGLSVVKRFAGVNVNLLLPLGPGALERLAGRGQLTGVRVSVAKAGEKTEQGGWFGKLLYVANGNRYKS